MSMLMSKESWKTRSLMTEIESTSVQGRNRVTSSAEYSGGSVLSLANALTPKLA